MESFVYEWINKTNNMRYIGKHVGNINDGYIASGKYFLEDYKQNPDNFYRVILWYGKESECFTMESYYIKTRINDVGIELLYNRTSTKGKLDYDFYYRNNLLNFVKCNHCGEVFNKTDSYNERELLLFEKNHYKRCTKKKQPRKKRVKQIIIDRTPKNLYEDCIRLHEKIDKCIASNRNKTVINKFKAILKERAEKCNYEYPY